MARQSAERMCDSLRQASAEQTKHTDASDAQVTSLKAELVALRQTQESNREALDASRSKYACCEPECRLPCAC